MPLSWQDTSEIVCGKVIKGEYSINAVRPDIFFPPYCDIIKAIKAGTTEIEDLIEIIGLSPIQAALDSIKDINGLGEANWVKLLERTYASYTAGQHLEKFGRRLQKGDEVDWSTLEQYKQRALEGIGGDFIPLSKVEPKELPFIKTGWKILDDHLGGVPEVGLILVGGEPGSGKTTFMGKLAPKFAEEHPGKKVAIFSIEMILSELAMRFNEVGNIPDEVKERILLNDYPVSADELINKAATIDGLGMICVDFLDMMIRESSEQEYSKIYLTLANGAKRLHVPIVVIVQLVKYAGGIPKKKHLRYTRMAEAFPAMILMLYDPSTSWSSEEDKESDELPIQAGTAFIIAWKVRGGFRAHLDEAPGAIQASFRGDVGWGSERSKWHSLKKVS